MEAYRAPTLSSNGTLLLGGSVAVGEIDMDLGLLVPPNNNINVTVQSDTANTPHILSAMWVEQ